MGEGKGRGKVRSELYCRSLEFTIVHPQKVGYCYLRRNELLESHESTFSASRYFVTIRKVLVASTTIENSRAERESNMHRRAWLKAASTAGVGLCSCCGCKSAPVTGRHQLMLIPEQSEIAMGSQAFADVNKEPGIAPSDSRYSELVHRVGLRIAGVSDRQDYQWETRVVSSSEQNAYCLPGGKIVVYDGILPVCENEAGLAVVMSHEVAHVLARHGGERMSQQTAVNGVQTAVGYVMRNKEQVSRDIFNKAYGMATTYGVVLPYSRKHESEADHIGLMLMARAGYDPAEAPRFWTRFAAANTGEKPAEFLSTHPADFRRASDLERLLPEALDVYRTAAAPIGMGELIV